MNGKQITVAGIVMLVVGVALGILGGVLFGEQKGGAAEVLHVAQLALLAAGVISLVVGAVAHLASGRRGAA